MSSSRSSTMNTHSIRHILEETMIANTFCNIYFGATFCLVPLFFECNEFSDFDSLKVSEKDTTSFVLFSTSFLKSIDSQTCTINAPREFHALLALCSQNK